MFLTIILYCILIYICRIILSPFIIYPLAFIHDWNKLWWVYDQWWFCEGYTIKDVLEDIKEQEYNDMFRKLYWIPIFGFFGFIFYLFSLLILTILFSIGLIFRLTITWFIVPLSIYIFVPIYKKIVIFFDFIKIKALYLNVSIFINSWWNKLLNIKISY